MGKIDSLLSNKSKLNQFLFTILLYLSPTQFAKHFWPDWALVSGIRVDYLAPSISILDLLISIIILFNIKQLFLFAKSNLKLISIFIFLILINIIFSKIPQISLSYSSKLMFLFTLAVVIANNAQIFVNTCRKHIPIIVILLSVISILQVISAKSLGGIFYLMGERTFTIFTPSISKANILSNHFLRPYATFPHPNTLSAYLSVLTIALLSFKKNKTVLFSIILSLFTLFFCFSQNSWLGLFLVSIVFIVKIAKITYLKLFLIFCFIISLFVSSLLIQSNSSRLELLNISNTKFNNNLMFGLGFGGFIPSLPFTNIQENSALRQTIWWLQPVHNIYLLLLSELGVAFLIFVIIFLLKYIKKENNQTLILILFFIFFTGLFDHYWITQEQTQLLLAIVLGLVLQKNKLLI